MYTVYSYMYLITNTGTRLLCTVLVLDTSTLPTGKFQNTFIVILNTGSSVTNTPPGAVARKAPVADIGRGGLKFTVRKLY